MTSTSATTTATTRTTTAPTTTTRPQPIAFRQGETATAGCAGTKCDLSFTLTKITDCTGEYAGSPPPEGSVRKLLWVEVETGSRFSTTDLPSGAFTQFTAINARGFTSGRINPSSYWTCAPEGSRMGAGDENWLPGKKYGGAIEVYLPLDAVKVVNAQGFWEWQVD
ncbi:hypothetical protein [Umezawaea tangerina]|uniref:hypothetical protein n=1 Tax=Umezawaea tangerina TaxID=84725 RepID=UPI0011B25B3A|nr:hypothetical protein [Umezawaea tangerina]